jgi:uncharacterized cofD-like protein
MTGERHSGLDIVAIGGGTGLATVLSGLKKYVQLDSAFDTFPAARIDTLTGVVTVTDDGGSSGRLRQEFQMLPPGDVRNCLVALAEDEHLLTRLLQYRFESDGALSGHSFGNILLTALTHLTGDFVEAIKLASEVLNIKGRIFPSTTEDVTLIAEMADGRLVRGETRIVESRSPIKRMRLSKECCQPLPETLAAIERADLITIGPGSLYTSIIPNLLVDGIASALCKSDALRVYICNVMTQSGETDGFTVEDHVSVLMEYSPGLQLDCIIANSAPVSQALLEKYLAEGARPVVPATLESCNSRTIFANLVSEDNHVRHDPIKLADLLMEYHRSEQLIKVSR